MVSKFRERLVRGLPQKKLRELPVPVQQDETRRRNGRRHLHRRRKRGFQFPFRHKQRLHARGRQRSNVVAENLNSSKRLRHIPRRYIQRRHIGITTHRHRRHVHTRQILRCPVYIRAVASTLLGATIVGSSIFIGAATEPNAHAASLRQTQKAIQVGTRVFSKPFAFAASDGSNLTTFMPIWYVGQALEAVGIRQSWNAVTHAWTLTTEKKSNLAGISVGAGPAGVVVNGQLVRRVPYYVARDPAAGKSAQKTVYFPIYYVDEILRASGFDTSWNGQTWWLSASPAKSSTSSSTPLLFGFVTKSGGSSFSLSDLESHPEVRAFSTPTYRITAQGNISGQPYPAAMAYAQTQHLHAYVTINNYSNTFGNFDGKMTEQLLSHSAKAKALITNIVALVKNTSLAGVNIDFEMLPPSSSASFVSFLGGLEQQLHQVGKQLSVDVPGVTHAGSGYNYSAIGHATDDVIVMAYDYSYPGGPAGAIAPLWWVLQVVRYAVSNIPADHVILGIPVYAYDWHDGTTTALSLTQVDKVIAANHITPKWDSKDCAPYFTYTSGSSAHTVYYENVQSLTDKLNVAHEYGLRGISLWHMGLENSAAWTAINGYLNQP